MLHASGSAVYGGNAGPARAATCASELETLEREIVTLRAQAERADAGRSSGCATTPRYIEKLAREELGYVRPGETVLKFPSTGRSAAAK